MRHVRMRIFGISLLVALIAGALGAGTAMAKDKYSPHTWQQYKHCPFNAPEITDCFTGITNGGSLGGYFQKGTVLVKLSKPITIQGGFKGEEASIEVYAPEDGTNLLESPEEPIVKGLKVITPKIQAEAEWPEALKASFAEAVKNKETKATATIEMAGDECTTVPGCVDTNAILERTETPPAFKLALKVNVKNAWLESLGGGPCLIGSDEHPIKQNLNTAGAGSAGTGIEFNPPTFNNLELANTRLVDVGWEITPEQGANGCGGSEYEAYVDAALNRALEVGSGNLGVTVLTGNLHDAMASAAKEEIEKGSK